MEGWTEGWTDGWFLGSAASLRSTAGWLLFVFASELLRWLVGWRVGWFVIRPSVRSFVCVGGMCESVGYCVRVGSLVRRRRISHVVHALRAPLANCDVRRLMQLACCCTFPVSCSGPCLRTLLLAACVRAFLFCLFFGACCLCGVSR